MMKRAIPIILGLGILAAFAWTLVFLYKKSQAKPVVFQTETAFEADIVKKAGSPTSIFATQKSCIPAPPFSSSGPH